MDGTLRSATGSRAGRQVFVGGGRPRPVLGGQMRNRPNLARGRVVGLGLTLGLATALTGLVPLASAQATNGAAGASHAASVKPSGTGELDCNGYSTIQRSVRLTMACTDVRGLASQDNQ